MEFPRHPLVDLRTALSNTTAPVALETLRAAWDAEWGADGLLRFYCATGDLDGMFLVVRDCTDAWLLHLDVAPTIGNVLGVAWGHYFEPEKYNDTDVRRALREIDELREATSAEEENTPDLVDDAENWMFDLAHERYDSRLRVLDAAEHLVQASYAARASREATDLQVQHDARSVAAQRAGNALYCLTCVWTPNDEVRFREVVASGNVEDPSQHVSWTMQIERGREIAGFLRDRLRCPTAAEVEAYRSMF